MTGGPREDPREPVGDEREVPLEDERSADDRDEGWGERSGSGSDSGFDSGFDDDWYLEQRPPHWD